MGNGEGGEQSCASRSLVGARGVERGMDHAPGVGVADVPRLRREAQRRLDEYVGLVEALGEDGSLEERVAIFGLRRTVLRGAERGEQFGPYSLVGCGLTVVEVEGLLVPADGVVRASASRAASPARRA